MELTMFLGYAAGLAAFASVTGAVVGYFSGKYAANEVHGDLGRVVDSHGLHMSQLHNTAEGMLAEAADRSRRASVSLANVERARKKLAKEKDGDPPAAEDPAGGANGSGPGPDASPEEWDLWAATHGPVA